MRWWLRMIKLQSGLVGAGGRVSGLVGVGSSCYVGTEQICQSQNHLWSLTKTEVSGCLRHPYITQYLRISNKKGKKHTLGNTASPALSEYKISNLSTKSSSSSSSSSQIPPNLAGTFCRASGSCKRSKARAAKRIWPLAWSSWFGVLK